MKSLSNSTLFLSLTESLKVRKQYILVGNGILNGCKFVQILGIWWSTEEPSLLQSMGLQTVGHALATEQQHT